MTQEELKNILKYDPETGLFTWLVSAPPRGRIGQVAGTPHGKLGYVRIRYKNIPYYAHRLAFLYMEGYMPKVVDHINRNTYDNRWVNLRSCSHNGENLLNQGNIKGYRQDKGKWYVRYSNNIVAVFNTENEAKNFRRKFIIDKIGFDPDNVNKTEISIKKRSSNKQKLYCGKTLTQISKETGIPQPTLWWRINNSNMDLEEAIAKG